MRAPHQPASEEHIGRRDLTRWPSAAGGLLARAAVQAAGWVSANVVLAVALAAGALLVSGLTTASAEIYEAIDEGDGISRWDRPALQLAIALRTPANTEAVTVFTHLGGPVGMSVIATVIILVMTAVWRSWTPVILMVVGVAGSLTMTTVGKAAVGRVRPLQTDAVPPFESSPSFPSGHTLNSTVIAGLVAYLLLRRLQSQAARVVTIILTGAWAFAMGMSRVFLGHHWLTDVAVGWTLGLAWVGLVILAHRLFLTVRRSRRLVLSAAA